MHRSTVILMIGEPGSGKTRLGTELARSMRVPFLARDDVRTGLYFTEGAWSERPGPPPSPDAAVETFLTLVETMAGLGVSCVAEYVFREQRPEDLDRITNVANCVGVRTTCDDASRRRVSRDRADRLLQRRPVLDALGLRPNEEHVADADARMARVAAEMRRHFDFPVLSVDTNDGYRPPLDVIVEFVASSASPTP